MAVTFKVPKSPKREIAATDSFMGVDLTNTGVSVEGYRSPHAPNMIRHVPGKVRKRMGYYKEILFGTKTNVNFASGTSAKLKEMMISSSEVDTWIKLYDLIQTISSDSSYTLYVEFDYASEEDFYIINNSTVVEAAQPDDEGNYPHFSGTISCASTDEFTEVDVKSGEPQEIFIKNFSLMLAMDSSYEWSPAPRYFVERSSNDPVYGAHYLKKGDGFDGDRVVNTNRVLGFTSGMYNILPDADADPDNLIEYNLAEIPCMGQTVNIDITYRLGIFQPPGSVYPFALNICGKYFTLNPTGGNWKTESWTTTLDNATTPKNTKIYVSMSDTLDKTNLSFSIRFLTLTYEKDNTFTPTPAPEANKEKFYIKDMYSIDPENFSQIESVEKDTTSFTGSKTETFEICTSSSHGGQYQYISLDLSTSLINGSSTGKSSLYIKMSNGDSYAVYNAESMFKKKHIDLFAYMPDDSTYINNIDVSFSDVTPSTKAHISVSNLSVKNYEIRPNFHVSSKWYLYHVGKDFYLHAYDRDEFTKVYSEANEHISKSWQLNNNCYIIDGKDIYEFTIDEGESVKPINQENAYKPIVTIAKEPSGGGTSYKPINLLQPGFYEMFQGKASVTKYQLTFGDLDDTPVEAWTMDASGNWITKEEGTDFTVDRDKGTITFSTAPGASPITGEDNVKILAYRTVEGYRDRIVKCITGALFGVGGAGDRLFLTGNPEHPNWDFYSEKDDPTYFPDTGYSVLGSEQSKIMGYAIVSNYLAAFKDGFDQSQTVFVREGDILKNEETGLSDPVFKLINTLQGEGVVASYSFGYLQTEPVFLTKAGIYAITEQDITGEKYSQNRSFYLDGKLRKEQNLDGALATVYDNQYILAINGQLYVLDGLQATRTDKSEPYATRQYAGFYCTDIPAVAIWTDECLCFGTADGKVCKFYTDEEALTSYNDDGKPIYACWETPDLDGNLFYKNKTFRYFAARMMKAIKTSVKIYSKKLGIWTMHDEEAWTFIREDTAISNPLDFDSVDFDLFTFSVDTTEKVIHTKLRVKKVDKARFRVENDKLNEPFGLNDLALEYIESGNYKG